MLHEGDPLHERSRWTWSGEFRRLLGFDRNDFRGFPNAAASWSDRLHPEDADPTLQAFLACLNDRSGATGYDIAYRQKVRSGQYRWFRAVGGVSRDPDGLALRACGSLIDIHDLKSAEIRREAAEAERASSIEEIASTLETNIASSVVSAKETSDTVAAAAEELAASIAEISSRMNKAAEASSNASEEAINTNEKVQGLAAAAERISAVVSLISDIAGQT
ncbi:MAG: PAS domain-containing protein, partial [Alphaproteobacteria bacterium]